MAREINFPDYENVLRNAVTRIRDARIIIARPNGWDTVSRHDVDTLTIPELKAWVEMFFDYLKTSSPDLSLTFDSFAPIDKKDQKDPTIGLKALLREGLLECLGDEAKIDILKDDDNTTLLPNIKVGDISIPLRKQGVTASPKGLAAIVLENFVNIIDDYGVPHDRFIAGEHNNVAEALLTDDIFKLPRTDAGIKSFIKLLNTLVEEGLDVNHSEDNLPCLLQAVFYHSTDPELRIIKALVDHGADVNREGFNGSPLQAVLLSEKNPQLNEDLADFLISKGSYLTIDELTFLIGLGEDTAACLEGFAESEHSIAMFLKANSLRETALPDEILAQLQSAREAESSRPPNPDLSNTDRSATAGDRRPRESGQGENTDDPGAKRQR